MTQEDIKRVMVDKANRHREAMQHMCGGQALQYVEGIIEGAAIVLGVFHRALH